MHRAGIRCLRYIDDVCCALPSRAEALAASDLIEDMFASSGLTKAPDKGIWEPTQVLPDHLGFEVSTASLCGHLRVPARRCCDIASSGARLLHHASDHRRQVFSEELRVFVGKAITVSAACDQARFRLRGIHDVLEQWRPSSTLSRAAQRDLKWWSAFAYECPANGVALWPTPPTRAIYTDASSTIGFDAVLSAPKGARKSFGGWWSLEERVQWHITLKELVAVRRGIAMFQDDLRGRVVRLWEDNQAVVQIIRNKTSRSPALMSELRSLVALLEALHITLLPRYIRSDLNPADEFSRLTNRNAWHLQPSVQRMLLHKVTSLVGAPVTLDAFACHQSRVGPLNSLVWYVPSLRYTRGLGWRMHCGAEVTESSTNKQHPLSMSALRVASLRAGGTGFRWTRARLAARGRMAESSLGSPPRYHWQARGRAASGCADRALLDDADVVAESPGLKRSSPRSSTSPLLRRPASPPSGGTFSAPRSSFLRSRLSRADSDLARAALGVNTRISSCPLIRRAAKLLAHGRRTSTKTSYCGKWQRFVDFCTVTLPQFYHQPTRSPLPAATRTVLLYIAHLSTEGLVSESSLNPYLAAINQAHEDLGYNRPALGHYFRLARAGWRTLEGAERLAWSCATPGTTAPTRACFSSGATSLSTFAASQSMFRVRLSLGTLPAPFTGRASLAMTLSALFSAFFNCGTTPQRPGSDLVTSIGPSLRMAPFGVPPSSTHGSSSSS
jgi:hypothetical protein